MSIAFTLGALDESRESYPMKPRVGCRPLELPNTFQHFPYSDVLPLSEPITVQSTLPMRTKKPSYINFVKPQFRYRWSRFSSNRPQMFGQFPPHCHNLSKHTNLDQWSLHRLMDILKAFFDPNPLWVWVWLRFMSNSPINDCHLLF